MIVAAPVPHEYVGKLWQHVAPHIARAERRSGWQPGEAQATVVSGQALLWVVIDGPQIIGAALSELHGDSAYATLLGGERFADWRDEIITKFETWARAADCKRCVIEGRNGWSRVLASAGYKWRSGALVKDLDHG